MVWSGADARRALSRSGIGDRIAAAAASQLQNQRFLQECANQAHSFLAPLSPEIIEELSAIAEVQAYRPNSVVFREGSAAGGLYIVKQGSVSM